MSDNSDLDPLMRELPELPPLVVEPQRPRSIFGTDAQRAFVGEMALTTGTPIGSPASISMPSSRYEWDPRYLEVMDSQGIRFRPEEYRRMVDEMTRGARRVTTHTASSIQPVAAKKVEISKEILLLLIQVEMTRCLQLPEEEREAALGNLSDGAPHVIDRLKASAEEYSKILDS